MEEIKKLFNDCIDEGASVKDALEHILNFYSISHLVYGLDNHGHTVKISRKNKNKEYCRSLKK